MKTVAAFANSHGGTLLIGVDDEGQIRGLEKDYLSLNNTDRDGFELYLRNLLNQQFGTLFIENRLQIQFYEVEDNDICQIEIIPAIKTSSSEIK